MSVNPHLGFVDVNTLWSTSKGAKYGINGVRPVVLLKPRVKLNPATPVDGVNAWDFAS